MEYNIFNFRSTSSKSLRCRCRCYYGSADNMVVLTKMIPLVIRQNGLISSLSRSLLLWYCDSVGYSRTWFVTDDDDHYRRLHYYYHHQSSINYSTSTTITTTTSATKWNDWMVVVPSVVVKTVTLTSSS